MLQLETFLADVRLGLRLLARTPFLSAAVVLILALGIGLNSAMFTGINAIYLRPMVTKDADRFAQVLLSTSRNAPEFLTQDVYAKFANADSFAGLAASNSLALSLGDSSRVTGMLVSCNYLPLHINPPVLGRTFLAEECAKPGGEPVVVLSEPFWRSQFQADLEILGRQIVLNKLKLTVIGVAPGDLVGNPGVFSVWLPYTMGRELNPGYNDRRFQVTGMLKPGITHAQAQAELTSLAAGLEDAQPGRTTRVLVTDGSMFSNPALKSGFMVLFALTLTSGALTLVLVCANVAGLLLSRSTLRRQEMAIRSALGGGRVRLMRQLLTESLLLALVATGVSLWLAYNVPSLIWRFVPGTSGKLDFPVDGRILGFTLGVAFLAALGAGLSPALESLKFNLASTLKPLGRGGAGKSTSRLRSALVATQLAISLAVLISAAFVVRSQIRLLLPNLRYDPESIIVTTLTAASTTHDQVRREVKRIEELPGVDSVILGLPFGDRHGVQINPIPGDRRRVASQAVSSGYFAALGIPRIRGRWFNDDEATDESQPVEVVASETFARTFWPGQEGIGQRWTDGTRDLIVIGVAGDASGNDEAPPLLYYLPASAEGNRNSFFVHASTPSGPLIRTIQEIVRNRIPEASATTETMASKIERRGAGTRLTFGVISIPIGLALLISLLGTYGMASSAVAQRRHELAVRMALGAGRTDVARLLLKSNFGPIGVGLLCGLGLAIALGIALRNAGAFPSFSAVDPLIGITAVVLVGSAALLATFGPTRRAAHQEPWVHLRDE